MESAIKEFEANGRIPDTITGIFTRLWEQVKLTEDFDKLVYTETETSWESLLRCGVEMCLLYEIRVPGLPISTNPPAVWSQNLRKKIFPGTELDKLENKAVYDILSFPAWNHPMLPKIEQPDGHLPTRTLVIDMKTSGEDLNTELVGLDPQLAEYAWQGRVPDVAFLWFVKKGHDVRKGSRVTLLQKLTDDARPGFELCVLWVESEKEATAKKPATPEKIYLGTHETLAEYEKAAKGITGKALEEFKAAFSTKPAVYLCPREYFTKQRLQFGAARLTEQQIDETGRSVAQTTVEMVRAHREGFYPS